MVRYLFYTIGDLTYQSPLVVLLLTSILTNHRNWNILSVYTCPMVYLIKFYFTYDVSNWDSNLHFMSQFI